MNPPEPDPRVLMAAERTLLAWIRTGVAMMGFGFVVARFGLFLRELATAAGRPATHPHASPIVGTGLILLGAIVTAIAIVDHVRFLRNYKRGIPLEPRPVSLATILAAIIAAAGIGLAAYLIVV